MSGVLQWRHLLTFRHLTFEVADDGSRVCLRTHYVGGSWPLPLSFATLEGLLAHVGRAVEWAR